MKMKLPLVLLLLAMTAFSCLSAPINSTLNTNDYSVSAGGTVTAGCRTVTFVFSSDFSGTVNGVTYSGATDTSRTFKDIGEHVYRAIVYTRSAGSIRILETR